MIIMLVIAYIKLNQDIKISIAAPKITHNVSDFEEFAKQIWAKTANPNLNPYCTVSPQGK